MNAKWKFWGGATLFALAVVLLYRRRRAFTGARGFVLLFRLLVAAGEAWREARLRRRVQSLDLLPSSPPGPA